MLFVALFRFRDFSFQAYNSRFTGWSETADRHIFRLGLDLGNTSLHSRMGALWK